MRNGLCAIWQRGVVGFVLVVGSLLPLSQVAAATAYITSDYTAIGVGDTVLVTVSLDTEGKTPNTVQGDIKMIDSKRALEIKDFSLADSALSDWLKTPSLDDPEKIVFIGGHPGGFNDHSSLLFKIVVSAVKEGEVVFLPENFEAFDNDGKATTLSVSGKPFTLVIGSRGSGKNQWQDIVARDNTPPQDLLVSIGQDGTAFEGKKFLSLSATDKESGIDHFEVAEGNYPPVRSGNTYVLQDQRELSKISIFAFDKAGNKSEVTLTPQTKATPWIWGGFILVAVMFGYGAFRYRQYQKKRNV